MKPFIAIFTLFGLASAFNPAAIRSGSADPVNNHAEKSSNTYPRYIGTPYQGPQQPMKMMSSAQPVDYTTFRRSSHPMILADPTMPMSEKLVLPPGYTSQNGQNQDQNAWLGRYRSIPMSRPMEKLVLPPGYQGAGEQQRGNPSSWRLRSIPMEKLALPPGYHGAGEQQADPRFRSMPMSRKFVLPPGYNGAGSSPDGSDNGNYNPMTHPSFDGSANGEYDDGSLMNGGYAGAQAPTPFMNTYNPDQGQGMQAQDQMTNEDGSWADKRVMMPIRPQMPNF